MKIFPQWCTFHCHPGLCEMPSSCTISSYHVWLSLPNQHGITHYTVWPYFVLSAGCFQYGKQMIWHDIQEPDSDQLNLFFHLGQLIPHACHLSIYVPCYSWTEMKLHNEWKNNSECTRIITAAWESCVFPLFLLICTDIHTASGSTLSESVMQSNVSQRSHRKSSPRSGPRLETTNQWSHCMSPSYGGNNCQCLFTVF